MRLFGELAGSKYDLTRVIMRQGLRPNGMEHGRGLRGAEALSRV